jgi:uncharacterized heparinase superfamily protein
MTSTLTPSAPLPLLSPAAGWQALVHGFYRSAPYRVSLGRRGPDRIDLAVPFSWPDDRALADAILDETFLFAGRRHPLGRAPWTALPQSLSVAVALHGFEWLADLRAAGTKAAQQRARELVSGWIDHHSRWSLPAWHPAVVGRRLSLWLATADFLLADAEPGFRGRFLTAAAQQARHLVHTGHRCGGTAEAFAAVKGQLLAVLCLGIGELPPALARLAREIGRQVLADGGHVQRSPSLHLQVLRDLVDVRAALQSARAGIPPALVGAIERMAPMLRILRHGDGGLCLFNGSKEEDRRVVDAVLARAGVKGKAALDASVSGLQRIEAGRTVLVCDAGPPPPPGADGLAHAGTLSLEMSVGRERLVVNCGAYAGDDGSWRQVMRTTDAHSTLIVDAANSSLLGPSRGRRRTMQVAVSRREADGAVWLDASHDGYRRTCGVVHARRLFVADTGEDVRGEDSLKGPRPAPFRIRFHLHPGVRASMVQDGSAVLLRTAAGSGWRFVAVGGMLSLEESIYLGAADVPRRTQQIVVAGSPREAGARVRWAFRRQGGP